MLGVYRRWDRAGDVYEGVYTSHQDGVSTDPASLYVSLLCQSCCWRLIRQYEVHLRKQGLEHAVSD